MKKLSIFILLSVFWCTGAVQASPWETWQIQDNYVGGTILDTTPSGWIQTGSNNIAGDVIALSRDVNSFDIDWMEVKINKNNGKINVNIQTDFAGAYGTTYGDLFVSTDGWSPFGSAPYDTDNYDNGEDWEYVLDTSSLNTQGNGKGNIYSINDEGKILTSNDVMTVNSNQYRNNQEVLYTPENENNSSGPFVFSINNGNNGNGYGNGNGNNSNRFIQYAFNLSSLFGNDWAWEDELNLGFHWTMTCANDVIEGGIYKAAAVPEPGTMLLLGMGIAGLGAAGKKRFKKK
jgi:hypothetical protein